MEEDAEQVDDDADLNADSISPLASTKETAVPGTVTRKLREKASHVARTKAAKKRFLGLENIEEWQGAKLLGQGGFGCTRLFVKTDANQRVTEKIAIKESYVSHKAWNSDDFWWDKGQLWPREAKMQQLCSHGQEGKGGEFYIVKYHSHSVDYKNMTFRIYMEYMRCGDLNNLIVAQKHAATHRLVVKANRESGQKEADADEDQKSREHDSVEQKEGDKDRKMLISNRPKEDPTPEFFVWYFLRSMVTAIYRMRFIPGHPGMEIMHQDIKARNIFMTSPLPGHFPMYPVLKLGDFGSARLTRPEDPQNPYGFHGDGMTKGYWAPEMILAKWPRTCATNVWQVGRTALHLMNLAHPEQHMYGLGEDMDDNQDRASGVDIVDMMPGYDSIKARYSDKLTSLLELMLQYDPKKRISPLNILEYMDGFEDDLKIMEEPNTSMKWENSEQWLHWDDQPSVEH